MLIGIDASRYRHPHPTGVEVYSDHIIDGLVGLAQKQKKHQIKLYTSRPFPHLSAKIQRVLRGRRLWTMRHLTREMKQHPPDVLFVPSHVLPRRHPQKTVITIHDVAFRLFPQVYSFKSRLYLHFSTKQAVKRAWRLIVPSSAVRDDLIQFYRADTRKIVVIPHGFRPPNVKVNSSEAVRILRRFHLKKGDPYVFFVGRLEMKKNLSRLIQAFARFHKQYPEWRLILGGGQGVGFQAMMKALERENVLADVLMPGYLTEQEKHVLFSHARLFAFPSISEGFGLPILEAAAYGVPILASQIPALLDFGDLVDVFVDPHDIVAMADGLASLAHRPPRSKPRAAYSWKRAARSVWDLVTSSGT